MSTPLEAILADDYLGDLGAIEMDELRRRRHRCTEVETGLSYLRRMVQGRLDVVAAERARRVDGEGGDDLEGLIDRLPGLLAGSTRSPGVGRLPAEMGTGLLDDGLVAELEAITGGVGIAQTHTLDDVALEAVATELEAFERRVSDLRRALFDRIDAIEHEVTRRYRDGEASVDSFHLGPA